ECVCIGVATGGMVLWMRMETFEIRERLAVTIFYLRGPVVYTIIPRLFREETSMKRAALLAVVALLVAAPGASAQTAKEQEEHNKALTAARKKGLEWLTKNQAANGSWGGTYNIAVTAFACLSYLSHQDEPFDGEHAKALVKGLNYILSKQNEGLFEGQGHSWIHGQGFATLALSEAYGRSLTCKVKPDLDTAKG